MVLLDSYNLFLDFVLKAPGQQTEVPEGAWAVGREEEVSPGPISWQE